MKVFLDMDGVLTDFEKAVTQIGAQSGLGDDASEEDKIKMYKKIEDAGEEFWSTMEWKEDGRQLWEALRKFNPILLSAPGFFRGSVSGKKMWVKNNMPGVQLYIENDKYKYAEPDAILIDDMEKNVEAWKEAGGIGILHKSAPQTEREIIELALTPGIL